jgi:ergothioneine biosynthesis protein EgtB
VDLTHEARAPAGSQAVRFARVRAASEALAAPLSPEDCTAQSMPDASPVKWHLAHTSWFFETFVLEREVPGYAPYHPAYRELFNSYYHGVGPQHPRPERGLVTRPGLDEVLDYRRHVTEAVAVLFDDAGLPGPTARVVEIGLHHEQQHQELILTDVLHLFSCSPIHPVYREPGARPDAKPTPVRWHGHGGGLVEVGHEGTGFAFDNEGPRHHVWLEPFELASRLVTNGEYRAFVEDGGYERPELWLSDGWATVQAQGWTAPLYWQWRDGAWHQLGLGGLREVHPDEPVCHVSHYEADAYARWAGARLPSESEWEAMAAGAPVQGNFVESGVLAPTGAPDEPDGPPVQLFGDVWEWTRSSYGPYPGYAPPEGAIGEYNGKFMSNQLVLRGGSCVTPGDHVRATYRNFFYPDARWQWSGIRLARDAR